MKKNTFPFFIILTFPIVLISCKNQGKVSKTSANNDVNPILPKPYETKSTKNFSKVVALLPNHFPHYN